MVPKPNNLLPVSKQISQKPFYSLLPPSLNPNSQLINLISSQIKYPKSETLQNSNKLLPYLQNNSTLTSILLLTQSKPLSSLSLFSSLPTLPSPLNFSILIHALTFSNYYTHATDTLTAFINSHPSRDILASLLLSSNTHTLNWSPTVFDLLIKVYVKSGFLDTARDVLSRVLHMGFAPKTRTFNWVLNGLVNKDATLCWEIYSEMKRAGIASNDYTFNILVKAISRGGEDEKIDEFLEMMEMEGFYPDIITYNTLIDGYIRRKRLDCAVELFKVMNKRGVEPDLVTYTILMKGFCKEGKMDDAYIMFKKMAENGLKPDEFCFSVLIYGYCTKGMMVEGRYIFDEMVKVGLKVDEYTCNALIDGYVRVGKLLPCLNLISDLRKNKIVVGIDAYRSVLRCLCLENRPNAAKNILNWIMQDGYTPDLEMYSLIIGSFCRYGFVNEAIELKDEMIERDVKPGLDAYRSIIGCLCRLEKVDKGESLILEMTDFKLVPDSGICTSLVSGYIEKKDLSKAESILRSFARKFQIYDNFSLNALLNIYSEAGELDQLFELQNRMRKLGFASNAEACRLIISGLSRKRYLPSEKERRKEKKKRVANLEIRNQFKINGDKIKTWIVSCYWIAFHLD